MSFFEPLPPPPPESVRQWSPPAWDRPSEGTLPAIVPVSEIVHGGDNVVVELEQLRVYPNGFTMNLFILTNPHLGHERASLGMLGGAGVDPGQRFPRIGVRFADGRAAGREAIFPGHLSVTKDDRGIPTEPILRMSGGGGARTATISVSGCSHSHSTARLRCMYHFRRLVTSSRRSSSMVPSYAQPLSGRGSSGGDQPLVGS